jgi:hypothetical protein
MHGADHAGLLDQALGRPQRVAQIGATVFQFGRQCAIQYDHGLGRQECVKGPEH